MKAKWGVVVGIPALLFAGLASASCTSMSSSMGQATQGCTEFQAGTTFDQNTQVDVKVRAFMQASADLGDLTAKAKVAVRTACEHIATDLGANDSWSALGDVDDAISNSNGTGACDVARGKVVAVMQSDAGLRANFALVISRGACHEDFKAESDCEAGCNAQTKCDPGTVETRCEPGELSVKCSDKCTAQSVCEGSASVTANCSGTCSGECRGSCTGACIDEHGKRTDNDPQCRGKCDATCDGSCAGECTIQLQAGVQCGASVSCRGSCTSSYTDPVCETEFTPPSCTIDETCFESCRTSVASRAVCDPPTVMLEADVSQGPDVGTLTASINANMPPLVALVQQQSKLAVKVAGQLAVTGEAVIKESGNLDGHSIACANAAAQSASGSASTLQACATGSSAVTDGCGSHAK